MAQSRWLHWRTRRVEALRWLRRGRLRRETPKDLTQKINVYGYSTGGVNRGNEGCVNNISSLWTILDFFSTHQMNRCAYSALLSITRRRPFRSPNAAARAFGHQSRTRIPQLPPLVRPCGSAGSVDCVRTVDRILKSLLLGSLSSLYGWVIHISYWKWNLMLLENRPWCVLFSTCAFDAWMRHPFMLPKCLPRNPHFENLHIVRSITVLLLGIGPFLLQIMGWKFNG